MHPLELSVGLRNILIVQLLVLALAPGPTLRVRRALTAIWKSLTAPFVLSRPDARRKCFREIDLTKFEP